MHGISLLVRHRKMEKRKKGIDHGASYSVPAAVLYSGFKSWCENA